MKRLNPKLFSIWGGVVFSAIMLAACSTVDMGKAPQISTSDRLVVLPIANQTETPEAGQRAASIAESILHQKGFEDLRHYPQEDNHGLLMSTNPDRVTNKALEWARNAGAIYALTGAVHEWRYKVGIDGEPVVGITFKLIDVDTGALVWSATGSRSGWSRSSLSGVAQSLIAELLSPLGAR